VGKKTVALFCTNPTGSFLACRASELSHTHCRDAPNFPNTVNTTDIAFHRFLPVSSSCKMNQANG
jgi:hypothetical protein